MLRNTAAFGRVRIERIAEHPLDLGERQAVAVEPHRLLHQRVVAPQVVDAQDVIGVTVREGDRVDARDAMRQRLSSQVGTGIDEQTGAVVSLNQEGRALAPVAWVLGSAGRALAADHRHAVGGTRAKERDLQAAYG